MPELIGKGAFEVIRIPADGSALERVSMNLIAITADRRITGTDCDAGLSLVPDMNVYWYDLSAAFGRRLSCPSEVLAHKKDPDLNGRYYLIKTLAANVNGLPLNKHEFWKDDGNRQVWGDAVIFKIGTPQLGKTGRVIHIDVPESMLDNFGLEVVKDIMTTAARQRDHNVYTFTSS